MNDDVDAMQLAGQRREEALESLARQLDEWDMKMPPVEPLVLDFGRGDFDHVGLIEYWIANEVAAGYCGKYLFVFDGQQCPAHGHRQKHETFFVVKGAVRMATGGKEQFMHEGDVMVMPPDEVHSFTGAGNALILEVSTPCLVSDNQFEAPEIAAWLKSILS